MAYPVPNTTQDPRGHTRCWDTIYSWIASDIASPGTIVATFLVGRPVAMSWRDSLPGCNLLVVEVAALFMVLRFSIPANNQCCQDGKGLRAFYLPNLAWLLTRRSAADLFNRPSGSGGFSSPTVLS